MHFEGGMGDVLDEEKEEGGGAFRPRRPIDTKLPEESRREVFDRLQKKMPDRYRSPKGDTSVGDADDGLVDVADDEEHPSNNTSTINSRVPLPKKEPKRASFIDPESYYLRITVPAGVCTSPPTTRPSKRGVCPPSRSKDNVLHVVIDRYTPLLSIIDTYGGRYFPAGGQLVLSRTGELLAGSSYAKPLGLQTAAQMIEKEKRRVREALMTRQRLEHAAIVAGGGTTATSSVVSVRQATADTLRSFDGLSLEAALQSGPNGRTEDTASAPRDIGESALEGTAGSDVIAAVDEPAKEASASQFLSLCNDLCYVTGVELDEVMERKRIMTARLVARNTLVAGLQSLLRWERNREARCPPTYLDVDGLVGQLERDRCTYLRRIVRRQVKEDVSAMPGLGALPMESTTSDDSSEDGDQGVMPSHMVDVSIGDPSHEEKRARKLVAESCADINSRYPTGTVYTSSTTTTPLYKGCKAFPAEGAYEIRERMRRLLAKEYAPEAFLWGTQHQQSPTLPTKVSKGRGDGLTSTTTSRSKKADKKRSKMGGGALWGSRDLGAFFDGLVPDATLLAQQRAAESNARSPPLALELQAHQAAHRSLFDRVYKQLNAIDGVVDREGGVTPQHHNSDALAHDGISRSINAILTGPYAPVATGRDGRRLPGSGFDTAPMNHHVDAAGTWL